jgi:hypothetical protein
MPLVPRICAPVGEIGPLDALDQRVLQFFARRIRILERPHGARGDLAQVVRRDVGGHAHRDTDGSVDQEVGEAGRKDDGLEGAAVVVVLEVDGLFLDVAHHLERERGHLGLGVARRGSPVVAGRAEVSLAEGERVAQAPGLDEAHEGVVDRRVAVRVELAHDLADHAGRLRECAVGAVSPVVHRVDHSAVHGLEPVAHVGKRPAHDDAHGVVEVGALHLELQVDLLDAVGQCSRRIGGLGDVARGVVSHGVLALERVRGRSASNIERQMSRKRTSLAFFWMKLRRDSTSSPMRVEKISSAAAASSSVIWRSVRVSGSMVVSHSSR